MAEVTQEVELETAHGGGDSLRVTAILRTARGEQRSLPPEAVPPLVLPAAERLLPDQLAELGARMTKRRLELTAARTPELASSVARSLSLGTLMAGGTAVLAGAQLLARHRPLGAAWQRPARTL